MIQPTASFKDNLLLLPSIDGLAGIEIVGADGAVIEVIENAAGKKGSLAVYQYLAVQFEAVNAEAAAHGLALFAEHTEDAKNRPGAHPNIDRLFRVVEGGAAFGIRVKRP
ncbi:DUF2322 family protein [Sulfitobacter sp. M57]|uniref:DUF2322 family protein n=1 Tax=unclassified Sulfitobacter TaxID=196795 RepID=UPI0023E0BBAB|nr:MULTISPECIES: DUF2322 family protein [unclassified Sulfitobacter]MDF3414657.1 DUF2322 family protein [Sulfitobacter sp. KE5]MDF3422138.1 DUF2322 family protein [Sulfitobacter sp. KE43]MDF3433203.1 DUF2322 family protein [Sulfitobacter sp. KE42]MDF3458843.1 DUF2322 family protein [Sulfitobacter sp. S74]MDF3462742.1 DUF2322 family protein [Sulfitobacter sp. Ks18]